MPSLRFCALASGSRGNAFFISCGTTSLLLDAGLPGKEIARRLAVRGIDPQGLSAVIVSHEHTDHLKGVGVVARRWKIPVRISSGTWAAGCPQLGRIPELICFESGEAFSVGPMRIQPFAVSHDAADPVGFTISSNGNRIGIATDLGLATANVRDHLKGCALVVIEANHDPEMLASGPYPWPLKQRIRGRSGHLSNEDAARLIMEIRHSGLRHVVLGHLSETNNTPEKAITAVGRVLQNSGTRLEAARQDFCGEMIEIF
ncbi:MAG: MBL fold metallo-hydrolase [Desulfobacterales bacterium]